MFCEEMLVQKNYDGELFCSAGYTRHGAILVRFA